MPITPLYTAESIHERVQTLADAINRQFKGVERLHVVITLNGAFMFGADLVRKLDIPLIVHFVSTSSGSGIEKGEALSSVCGLPNSFGNHPVLIVEDIVDAGKTLETLRPEIAKRFCGEIKSCALLKRQGGKANVDFYGFTVSRGLFVVGYGMDMDGRYRECPNISIYGQATMSTNGPAGVC